MAAPLLYLAACGNGTEPRQQAEIPLPAAQIDRATAGTISGRVLFAGAAPVMPVIDMSSNPQCERQHHAPQKGETVVVNANKTLRNVFVWIKDGLPRVRVWGCWNEPNKVPGPSAKATAAEWYRSLANAMAPSVHSVPGDLMIAGELSPFGISTAVAPLDGYVIPAALEVQS